MPRRRKPNFGIWVILVPVVGGLIVGLMARWGSRAIRGHGIPEAMEQVLLTNRRSCRASPSSPVSSAIAIGTGGPFGAEGLIIATGGAPGSLPRPVAARHRAGTQVLFRGAAGGMTAIFGAPVSAVVLAVELLLFELRPRSLIPVALAAVTAAGMRDWMLGGAPVFAMPDVAAPGPAALLCYVLLGAGMAWSAWR